MGALSSHPSLKDIALRLPSTSVSLGHLQLNRLRGLRSLTIERIRPDYYDYGPADDENTLKGHITQIISQSPLLSCLSLQGSLLFRDIMMNLADHPEFANLTQLRLDTTCLSEADQRTFNLFKSLKSLHLDDVVHNYQIPADRGLWEKMRVAAIELNELTVNAVSKGLLHYLVSFSTLEMLHIALVAGRIPKHYKSDGRLLYHTILPLHGLSLVLQPFGQAARPQSLHYGLIYKRCPPEREFCRESLVFVCPVAVPQCLPFLVKYPTVQSTYTMFDFLFHRWIASFLPATSN